MGFYITIYKIDRSLPFELIWRDLELVNPGDITPGIYKKAEEFHVDVETVEEIPEAVERRTELYESDIVEWQVDDHALQNPSKELAEIMRTESNYFLMKVFGLEQIAIEKEKVFVELTLREIAEQFRV